MRHRSRAIVAIVGLLLVACVGPTTKPVEVDPALAAREAEKQREIAFREGLRQQGRLWGIAYRLESAAAALCGDHLRPTIGVTMLSALDVAKDFQPTARRVLGDGDGLFVTSVGDGSPAAEAGLRVGDRIVAIGGRTIPDTGGVSQAAGKILDETAKADAPLAIGVRRAGADLTVTARPVNACDYAVRLSDGEEVNAYADGETVIVTRGMMRFAQSDSDLATIVAHEIAHDAMGHIDAQKTNAVAGAGVGLIFDIIAAVAGVNTQGGFSRLGSQSAARAFSQEFEAEADYVGLYIMARAGMDVEQAPNLWRRMAAAFPDAIATNVNATHPSTPQRFVALEKTVAEIAEKRRVGAPLLPEIKAPEIKSSAPAITTDSDTK